MKNFITVITYLIMLLCIGCKDFAQKSLHQIDEKTLVKMDLEDKKQAEWNKDGLAMDLVNLKPGMIVGELGAGQGYYTLRLAERVGPTGKVYANDIDENDGLRVIRERATKRGLNNIVTVLGTEVDPQLPKNQLDFVFAVNAVHDFSKPVDVLINLAKSMKPGAKLVIIDTETKNQTLAHPKRTREWWLSIFEKSSFKVDLIDDKSLPKSDEWHIIIYVLSHK